MLNSALVSWETGLSGKRQILVQPDSAQREVHIHNFCYCASQRSLETSTTYSTFSLSLLPLGTLGMDLEERYKVGFFEEQVMKDQNRFWKHINVICRTHVMWNEHWKYSVFNRWVRRLQSCFYSKGCAVHNGIQKRKSCTLLAHCCIYNSLSSSGFLVFILGGKCLLQFLELSNDSLVWKQFSDFLHIARHEKSDETLNY